MGSTPEAKVKRVVSAILQGKASTTYYFMPVPGGYGESTLDYIGSNLGRFFAIETKAPGKKPTDRQKMIAGMMERSGAKVFVIDGQPEQYLELQAWLG